MLENTHWHGRTNSDTGILICTVERVDSAGTPWIRLPGGRECAAITTTSIRPDELARTTEPDFQVVVALTTDTQEPIIVGIVAPCKDPTAESEESLKPVAEIDGQRIELTGQDEVVLRCGNASITLTKAGKILLRGTYVSSRSSGVNRIKGGSVQIN
jgi:hypothetical protein